MHPIYEVDVLLLLAVTMASKRRPAELLEVVAAADLVSGGAVPSETRMVEAFHRLSVHGLIREVDGGFTLTADAQKVMSGQPKKAEPAERMLMVREKLADYTPGGGNVAVVITAQQACAAILAHRAAAKEGGKNLLMPKPKVEEEDKRRPAPWRRPGGSRGR